MIVSDELRLRAIIGPTKIVSSDPSLTSVRAVTRPTPSWRMP
jgi:hypothetical protein